MVGAKQFAIMRKIIEDKKENPIVKNIAMPPWMRGEQEFSKPHGNFLDKFKPEEKEVKVKKEPTSKKEEFSEELINRLTYQVFQNIKSYLDKTPENPIGSKHIKLEISL
jgi:hypothetical protein